MSTREISEEDLASVAGGTQAQDIYEVAANDRSSDNGSDTLLIFSIVRIMGKPNTPLIQKYKLRKLS